MTNTNNSLSQRHAHYQTPENIIFDLIKTHTGCTALYRSKIVKGYDSEVYSISTQEGASFIIRIKHHGGVSYAQEAWAINKCRSEGVPVPHIYAIGNMTLAGKTHEYMIQAKVQGQPLAEVLTTLSNTQLNQILHEIGNILRRVHTIKAGGFYRRHTNGTWDFPSWQSVNNSNVHERIQEQHVLLQAGFSHHEINFMLQHLARYRDSFTCAQPVLCHGDFTLEHIFVDNTFHVCAIIDFGMFEGNHPIHDLAYFNWEYPNLPLQALIDGYGEHEMFHSHFSHFNERLTLHQLSLQMGYLAHFIRTDLKPEASTVNKQLRKTLQQLLSSSYEK